MCGCASHRREGAPTPYDVGRGEIAAGRRTLLRLGGGIAVSTAALAAGAGTASATRARGAKDPRRAYVIVVDGCLPEEIDGGLTPNLRALRNGGLRFSRASSMPIMETIPNHTMMMTGVRPDRSGVPSNTIYDRKLGDVRTLEVPSDLKADTVIQRMNRAGMRTGTVLSKDYLYGIFGTQATHRWEPFPLLPITDHAPDEFTMRAATAMVEEFDPHLLFVNLGDIDRFGHSDLTGPTGVKALRRTALTKTDRLVGGFVDLLKSTGRWDDSIVIVLADHSMDWSTYNNVVSLTAPIEADPFLAGKVAIADNGGADLIYWLGPTSDRKRAVARIREIAQRVPGVLSTHDRTSGWLRLGPEAGDVVAYCKAGWRFSDPSPMTSNPIPGNHGHPATRSIPFFIGGGHPIVPKRRASSSVAHTIDVAPTVAKFFGLKGQPPGGYDGVSRL